MSGTVCCYNGCKKSYSTDKDVSFFKFPDDPKRRKKWMQHCANLELENLSDRQLRGKRICSDHFLQSSFLRPESRSALNDSAVPVAAKNKKAPPEVVALSTPGQGGKNKEPNTSDTKVMTLTKTPMSTPVQVGGRARTKRKIEPSQANSLAVKKVSIEPPQARSLAIIKVSTEQAAVSSSKAPVLSNKSPAKRRKKGMQDCANLSDRQLRGKRICSDNIPQSSISRAESKSALKNESAVPVAAKNKKATPEAVELSSPGPGGKSKEPNTTETEVASLTETLPLSSTPVHGRANKKRKIELPHEIKKVLTEPAAVSSSKTPVLGSNSPAKRREKGMQKCANLELENSSDRQLREKRICSDHIPKSPISRAESKCFDAEPVAAESTNASPEVVALSSPGQGVKNTETNSSETEVTSLTKTLSLSSPPMDVRVKKKRKSEPQGCLQEVKKVSIEAMMAAVSSTKIPVLSNNTPVTPVKRLATAPSIPTLPTPELCAVTVPKQKPMKLPSKPSVEILREKPKDGNNTVVVVRQGDTDVDNVSESDSYDEYMYYDREFEFEHEEDTKADREFERFCGSLKKYLRLPGKWTIGGVQWDPQGKRKVVIISEPEIPPNGRPCVKRCLQCFEDKSIRVFIDQMDMTDVFGMSCYAEKEDVAGLINRVADASSCCGVPEMVVDDLIHFPNVRKRNTSYFDPKCPGVISNDAYDPICTACKDLQILLMESRETEKKRLYDRRIRSEQKEFQHPFGQALYSFFNDLADETDPSKPKKKRTKETFFRKFLHDTRYKVSGDTSRTERVYIEKPISVDSVSQSFQDIVSKLGFNMPNAKKRPSGGLLPRPSPLTSTPKPTNSRLFSGATSNVVKVERKVTMPMDHILPFNPAVSSFTLDDGQEYELIGEVSEVEPDFVEMKPIPMSSQQQQHVQIIQVDHETMTRLASSKNQVVMLPEVTTSSILPSDLPLTTRIDANDPNLSQILKAINTSHGFKV